MTNPITRIRRLLADVAVQIGPADYLLRKAAARLGVASIGVDGPLGHFQGSALDRMVEGFYLLNRTWAPGLQQLLARLLRNGGPRVDAGANLRPTSIPLARSRRGRVYAVE